jgi:hypothetical protein
MHRVLKTGRAGKYVPCVPSTGGEWKPTELESLWLFEWKHELILRIATSTPVTGNVIHVTAHKLININRRCKWQRLLREDLRDFLFPVQSPSDSSTVGWIQQLKRPAMQRGQCNETCGGSACHVTVYSEVSLWSCLSWNVILLKTGIWKPLPVERCALNGKH